MRGASDIHIDMHRIGETIAGVVTDRNLEDFTLGVEIAAQDPKHWRAFVNLQSLGHIGVRRDRLNVLRDFADFDARQRFDLTEQSSGAKVQLINGVPQAFVKVRVGHRQRQGLARMVPDSLKTRPIALGRRSDLFGKLSGKRGGFLQSVGHLAPARVLQQLADIGERLVQSAAARRRGLHRGARSATPFDQTFDLQSAQGLANGEAADIVFGAQGGFGWKRLPIGERARQDGIAQFSGQLQVARRASSLFGRIARLVFRLRRQSQLHRSASARGGIL